MTTLSTTLADAATVACGLTASRATSRRPETRSILACRYERAVPASIQYASDRSVYRPPSAAMAGNVSRSIETARPDGIRDSTEGSST